MNNQEKRFLNSDFEVRNENYNTVIEGYAARFEDETVIGGQFAERVARGAFEGADMSNTVALFNHDWNMPLARVGKGLELSVDEVGLRYRFELGEQSYAKDLAENIRMGNVSTSSFGFTVSDDEWERRDGMNLRTINSVGTLFDVSPTTQGAYPTTEVAIRSMEAALEEVPVVAEEVVEEPVAEVVEEVVAEEVAEEVVEEERAYEESPKEDEEDKESEESDEEDEEEKAEERTEEVVAEEVTEDAPAVEEEEQTETILNSEPEARNTTPIMENTTNTPAVVQGLGDSEARAAKDFNFGKFISEAAKGNLTGLEAEMVSEGKNEMRNAGLNVAGGFNIPSAVLRSMGVTGGATANTAFGGGVAKADEGIVSNYAPNDIAAQLGIRNMAGLSGDVALQVQANLVAAGKNVTEGNTQAESLPSFAEKTLSPKRIAAHVGVTQQMLAQSSDDMAAFIQMDIRRALDKQFNDMIIDAIDDITAAGNSTAYSAGSTSPLHLEEDLLGNDVSLENIVGLCDAKAFRTARTLSLDAGSGLLYAGSPADRRSVLGYDTVVSSQIGGSGNDTTAGDLFFFDKSQVVTAQWGGLNLIVDPYTLAAEGVVRMIANEYRDVEALQAGGFARMTGL